MTTHPILGQVAPIESLGRAVLEAIESSGGCSVSAELAGINARALELPAFGQWLPIESAPKDGRTVMLSHAGFVTTGYLDECDIHLCWTIGRPITPFTHWMPLPLSPTKDSP